METLAKFQTHQQPLQLSLDRHFPSFSRPISSLSFKTPSSTSFSKTQQALKLPATKAFTSPHASQNPKPQITQTLKPFFSSFIKSTCITITAAALLFARLNYKPLHVIAAPVPPPTMEPAKESVDNEEKEKTMEEYLTSHPEDIEALKALMECKIKSRKLQEAIAILDRLIQIDPNEPEYPLLKSNLYNYSGESDLATMGFEEILQKDPLCVEAYHGLVMTVSDSGNGEDMKQVAKRIEAAMERCKKEKNTKDLRDFKLLDAQIRVIEGNYSDALKVYQELVKEEPRDFRPYLCQGIIYTLLRKKDEAEKNFQKYKRLVPKNHPYTQFFDDNMIATKVFSQKVENERVGGRS